jgi:hypothetical protein
MMGLLLGVALAGPPDVARDWGVPCTAPPVPLIWQPVGDAEAGLPEDISEARPLPGPFFLRRPAVVREDGRVERAPEVRVDPETGLLLKRRGPASGVRVVLVAGGVVSTYLLSALVASAGSQL